MLFSNQYVSGTKLTGATIFKLKVEINIGTTGWRLFNDVELFGTSDINNINENLKKILRSYSNSLAVCHFWKINSSLV